MKISRRAFLQLPLIAGITMLAGKAMAYATKPLVMGEWVKVERFYRKINGTNEYGNKIMEMFFSRFPDFSDNPEPVIINVSSFQNKQELADTIDILQRLAIEDMIQSRRKGKDYQQPYEIVFLSGQMIEKSEHYEILDNEIEDMVTAMNFEGMTTSQAKSANVTGDIGFPALFGHAES